MAAAPLQTQLNSWHGTGSNSKSHAIIANLTAPQDSGYPQPPHQQQQQQQQSFPFYRPSGGAEQSIPGMHTLSLAAIESSLRGALPDSYAAAGMHPPSQSVPNETPLLDGRALEQAERTRNGVGELAGGWGGPSGGLPNSAHAKVMMWDDSAQEFEPTLPEPIAPGSVSSEDDFSNCHSDLKVTFELPPAPQATLLPAAPPAQPITSKQEAAPTRLSAGVRLSELRRHTRYGLDNINALDPRKERCMNPEERTRRWLEALDVPILSEPESRRPLIGSAGGSSKHVSRSPSKLAGAPVKELPVAMKERQSAERQREPVKRGGLLSCFSCSAALD